MHCWQPGLSEIDQKAADWNARIGSRGPRRRAFFYDGQIADACMQRGDFRCPTITTFFPCSDEIICSTFPPRRCWSWTRRPTWLSPDPPRPRPKWRRSLSRSRDAACCSRIRCAWTIRRPRPAGSRRSVCMWPMTATCAVHTVSPQAGASAEPGDHGPRDGWRAIDFLLAESGPIERLEVDFFGGEPLLALGTVRRWWNTGGRVRRNEESGSISR